MLCFRIAVFFSNHLSYSTFVAFHLGTHQSESARELLLGNQLGNVQDPRELRIPSGLSSLISTPFYSSFFGIKYKTFHKSIHLLIGGMIAWQSDSMAASRYYFMLPIVYFMFQYKGYLNLVQNCWRFWPTVHDSMKWSHLMHSTVLALLSSRFNWLPPVATYYPYILHD